MKEERGKKKLKKPSLQKINNKNKGLIKGEKRELIGWEFDLKTPYSLCIYSIYIT